MQRPTQKDIDFVLDGYPSASKDRFSSYQDLSHLSQELRAEWFASMLEDEDRNVFYRKMIHSAVKDKIVVDLGSGTGIWCMESLNRGAKFVYVIERNPILAKYLESIFAGHPVKVMACEIGDLTPASFDFGFPEVLIHELFSQTGIGEGIIPVFQKMWELFPDRKMDLIPDNMEMEARVTTHEPFRLSLEESNFLKEKVDFLYEVVYPINFKIKNDNYTEEEKKLPTQSLLAINFKDIKKQEYELRKILVMLKPGKVHRIYVTFKVIGHTGLDFDSCKNDTNHWKSQFVEFYVAKNVKEATWELTIPVIDNVYLGNPYLSALN